MSKEEEIEDTKVQDEPVVPHASKDPMPAEHIMGFLKMMSSQPTCYQFATRYPQPNVQQLLKRYCMDNNIKMPRDHWENLVKIAHTDWRDQS